MNQASQLLTIAGVLLLGVATPGPSFALVTSAAMGVSRRAGVLSGLGLAAASGTWTLLTVAGIGIVLAHVPWIHTAVRLAGAACLIWLGLGMVAGARKPAAPATGGGARGAAAFRKAYLVSMTNPKTMAFYGSIFTVMVPASAPIPFYAAIVAVAALVSAGWYCGVALLFSQGLVRRVFARAKTAIDTVMGVVLVGLGGKLLVSR